MRRLRSGREAGFGLVEVLVATLVLALAVMGATKAFTSALDRQARDQRETQLLSHKHNGRKQVDQESDNWCARTFARSRLLVDGDAGRDQCFRRPGRHVR